jgi:hypothetical protein
MHPFLLDELARDRMRQRHEDAAAQRRRRRNRPFVSRGTGRDRVAH